jgi:hypothetical protein
LLLLDSSILVVYSMIMSDLSPTQALETVQNTKKIFVQIFTIVGHTEQEAQTNADKMFETIFELAVSMLVSDKADKGGSELTAKLQGMTEPQQLIGVLREEFSIDEIEEALGSATQQTMSYYFKQIGPNLDQEQTKKINNLITGLQADLGAE